MANTDSSGSLDSFNIGVRIASRIAQQHGLSISVEKAYSRSYNEELPCVVWRGGKEDFLSSGIFDTRTVFPARERWMCPGTLRGTMYRDGSSLYRFVIEGEYTGRDLKRSRAAKHDNAYQEFRAIFMRALPEDHLSNS